MSLLSRLFNTKDKGLGENTTDSDVIIENLPSDITSKPKLGKKAKWTEVEVSEPYKTKRNCWRVTIDIDDNEQMRVMAHVHTIKKYADGAVERGDNSDYNFIIDGNIDADGKLDNSIKKIIKQIEVLDSAE